MLITNHQDEIPIVAKENTLILLALFPHQRLFGTLASAALGFRLTILLSDSG